MNMLLSLVIIFKVGYIMGIAYIIAALILHRIVITILDAREEHNRILMQLE